MIKSIYCFSIFVILFGFNSCAIFNGNSNLDNLIQTFYVGESGTQYYIKPITFENKYGDELVLDMTFRYKDKLKDSASLNFTFDFKDLIKRLNKVDYINSNSVVETENIHLLFTEKNDELFKSRFSSKISLVELNRLMMNENWTIKLLSDNNEIKYFATNSAKEALNTFNNDLFILFR